MICYLETSAAAKLIFEEDFSTDLFAFLKAGHLDGLELVSSHLLETELRRAANRTAAPQGSVTQVLDSLQLVVPDRDLFNFAGMLPGQHLRSLDAIHIATALRASADLFLTYDQRQAEAAEAAGLEVHSPGS